MPATPETILDYLRTEASHPLTDDELAEALAVEESEKADFQKLLEELVNQGVLYRGKRGRVAAPSNINLVVGTLSIIQSGAGFVRNDEGGEDLYIPQDALRSAVDGDRVVARVEKTKKGGKTEGSVVRVLRRARETVVGVYHPSKNFGFVVPERSLRMSTDVFVPPGEDGGATEGDVVVVRISSWGEKHRGPVGEVIRVIGKLGEPMS